MLFVALHPGWIDRFTTSKVIADVDEDDENDYENEKPLMILSLT